jgi:hypothetical protein
MSGGANGTFGGADFRGEVDDGVGSDCCPRTDIEETINNAVRHPVCAKYICRFKRNLRNEGMKWSVSGIDAGGVRTACLREADRLFPVD